MLEYKSFDSEMKALNDGPGSIELYAAKFNNIDRAGERIEPGAFSNISEFIEKSFLAVNHDWSSFGGVGTIEDAFQDDKGLFVRAKFYESEAAQAVRSTVLARLSRSKSVPTSIGYSVTDDARVDVDGKSIRSLKSVSLWECSLVNVPCNPSAGVVGAKSLITLDELRGLVAEYKEGRVLSTANRTTAQGWRERLAAMLTELDALLDATEPAEPGDTADPTIDPSTLPTMAQLHRPNVPKSLLPVVLDLNREFLAISARHAPSHERG